MLSHGHYDHTGGAAQVIRRRPEIEVYFHPGAVQPRYSIRNGASRSIGMPREAKTALNGLPARGVHWVIRPTLIAPDVGVTGPIPRETPYEDVGGPFFLDPTGARRDPVDDDQALWINTPEGLVVCVGCCHAGLVNTLNHVARLNDDAPIRAFIGGFHLGEASDERLDRTIEALRAISPRMLAPCHCTGEKAIHAFKRVFGDMVSPGHAGTACTTGIVPQGTHRRWRGL